MNAKYFIAFNCCLSLTFLYRVDRKSSHVTVATELMFDTLKLCVQKERNGMEWNGETLCASAKNISEIINNKFLFFSHLSCSCLVVEATTTTMATAFIQQSCTKWMRAKRKKQTTADAVVAVACHTKSTKIVIAKEGRKKMNKKKRIGIANRRFYHNAPLNSVAKKSPMNPGM